MQLIIVTIMDTQTSHPGFPRFLEPCAFNNQCNQRSVLPSASSTLLSASTTKQFGSCTASASNKCGCAAPPSPGHRTTRRPAAPHRCVLRSLISCCGQPGGPPSKLRRPLEAGGATSRVSTLSARRALSPWHLSTARMTKHGTAHQCALKHTSFSKATREPAPCALTQQPLACGVLPYSRLLLCGGFGNAS